MVSPEDGPGFGSGWGEASVTVLDAVVVRIGDIKGPLAVRGEGLSAVEPREVVGAVR